MAQSQSPLRMSTQSRNLSIEDKVKEINVGYNYTIVNPPVLIPVPLTFLPFHLCRPLIVHNS